MFNKIRLINVAVNSLEDAVKDYEKILGVNAFKMDVLPAHGVKNALFLAGETVIELVAPLEERQGPVAKFLEKKGEGVYTTTLEVENLKSAIEDLKSRGVLLINDTPEAREKGLPVYIHPKASRGLMIKLVEKEDG
jgi:methylmalonyl-CoA/ethylmalonyl-CoA epimerase